MEFEHKVSKGSRFNQIYIPKEMESVFEVSPEHEGFSHPVEIGEIMQWQADENESLVVFEICFPPYQDGRFENLP